MNKFFITIVSLFTLCSCHSDDAPEEEPIKKAKRTVLVYMAAENNLNSYATDDLNEMKTGSFSLDDEQNLIVYIDKANSSTSPILARVKNGTLVDSVFMKEALSADPTVLENVIKYTKEHYPAKSYGLVLWGHASGWIVSNSDSISAAQSRAYGGSTGNNSSSGSGKYWMNIVPMAKAITNAMGTDLLKFVIGDCCSFACVEVAYELRNITEYVIGSPAEIPDMGAPFDLIVPDMFKETDNFYEDIIDHYYNFYIDTYKTVPNVYYNRVPGDLSGYSVPLAAIKSSELENFASATAKILTTIADKVSKGGSLDLENTMYYGIYGGYRYSHDILNVLGNNASTADFNTWLLTYNNTVPYCLYSKNWMTNFSKLMTEMLAFTAEEDDCGVFSMFFPSNYYTGTNPSWNEAIKQYEWNNVIHWEQYGW